MAYKNRKATFFALALTAALLTSCALVAAPSKAQVPEVIDRMVLGEYFGADWCGYCPRDAKENERMAEAHPDYIFIKYDADETHNVNVAGAAPVDRGTYYGAAAIPDTIVDGKYPSLAIEIEQGYTLAEPVPALCTISLEGSRMSVPLLADGTPDWANA
ncbi:MAG: hypothetical protein CVT47_03705, partial [Thermoplasmata archaeon HGW-Thermoplasmata-2]